jgi:hypothetical protein
MKKEGFLMQLSLIARLAQKDIHYLWFAIFASHFFLFVLHRFDARTALLVSVMDAVLYLAWVIFFRMKVMQNWKRDSF